MTSHFLDVLAMGRVGVDIYPEQVGVGLEDVTSFAKFLGGSPANVTVAAARHGRSTGLISRTGADPFGRFVRRALTNFGVDASRVTEYEALPTPVTFCEIFPPDHFPLYFYRLPSAPDLQLNVDELDYDAIRAAQIFWVTVTGLSQEPSRSATLAAVEARKGHGTTILDLDYRPTFWDSPEAATTQIARALPNVTVALGNKEECAVAVGESDPAAAAKELQSSGIELAIVKQGPDGVLGVRGHQAATAPPIPVDVVNGLGAGDAFGGALCHGLLAGWELPRLLRFANAAGAHVATQLSCADAMPSTDVVEALAGTAEGER